MAQGPAFKTKVPYRWIQGLPRAAQEQIWRNFEEIQIGFTAVVNLAGFDALVDPNALADDPVGKIFTSVGSALRALKPSGGWPVTSVNLGMRPGTGSVAGVTEPSAIASSDCPTVVRIVGLGDSGRASASPDPVAWALASNTNLPTSTPNVWVLENLQINPGTSNNNASLFQGILYLVARNVLFRSNGTTTTKVSPNTFGNENYDNCKFFDISVGGGRAYLNDCVCSAQINLTWGYSGSSGFQPTSLIWVGGNYECTGSFNMDINSENTLVDTVFGSQERTTSPQAPTVRTGGGAAQRVVINSRDAAAQQPVPAGPTYLHLGTAPSWVHLTGQWANVTVPGPGGANTGQNYLHIKVANENGSGTCDITGPAEVAIEADTQVLLRGAKITGSVFGRSNNQAVQGIGLTDSVLMVQLRSYGGGGGFTGFTLDAASTRNLILLGGDNDFGTGYTDSGTANAVVTRPVAGRGLRVAEGSNAKQGTATLAAGTVTVANTSVTASSRILLTAQDNNTTGALRVSARTAGTSFSITSSNAGDTGIVAYEIFEPA